MTTGRKRVAPRALRALRALVKDVEARAEGIVVTHRTMETFVFPSAVKGWLSEAEGRRLAELAAGKVVVEIGSYCGRSTICMAQVAEVVHAIDPHNSGKHGRRVTYHAFRTNLTKYGVANRVIIHRCISREAVIPPAIAGLVFVDGDHRYDGAQEDTGLALLWVRADGLLAFHDSMEVGVKKAIDELVGYGGELLERVDSLSVVKPPREAQ